MKDKVIQEILDGMREALSAEQLSLLKSVAMEALRPVDVALLSVVNRKAVGGNHEVCEGDNDK